MAVTTIVTTVVVRVGVMLLRRRIPAPVARLVPLGLVHVNAPATSRRQHHHQRPCYPPFHCRPLCDSMPWVQRFNWRQQRLEHSIHMPLPQTP